MVPIPRSPAARTWDDIREVRRKVDHLGLYPELSPTEGEGGEGARGAPTD